MLSSTLIICILWLGMDGVISCQFCVGKLGRRIFFVLGNRQGKSSAVFVGCWVLKCSVNSMVHYYIIISCSGSHIGVGFCSGLC